MATVDNHVHDHDANGGSPNVASPQRGPPLTRDKKSGGSVIKSSSNKDPSKKPKCPLHEAVRARDEKTIRKLLNKKSGIALLSETDGEQQIPLAVAVKNNDYATVELLLQFYRNAKETLDINIGDKNGYTPLHCAVSSSDTDTRILAALLQYKYIKVNIENDTQNAPLHYFCQKFTNPNPGGLFNMFIAAGANVNAQNNNGETPLHKAVFNNAIRLMMVKLLLEKGADVNIKNSSGETVLHYAVRMKREDLVSVLLAAGADITIRGLKDKKTPYELAQEERSEKIIDLLKNVQEIHDWLKEIDMEGYVSAFVKKKVFMDILPMLDDRMLDDMGITASGDRLRILKACTSLKAKQESETPAKPLETSKSVSSMSGKDTLRKKDILQATAAAGNDAKIQQLKESLAALPHLGEGTSHWIEDSELEFTEKLGTGASGKVYKGLYRGIEVAIKVLKEMTESKQIEEFKKEFQIMSAIKHPSMVTFYGACLSPKLCMVMELCSRGSLYHVLNDTNLDIGWDMVLKMSKQMCEGINCLHKWDPQILHRDLKSLNLLVNEGWHVKVADFGLSRFSTASNLETLGKMRGTMAYCCPEAYFGAKFTIKSDVYSIGIIFWELVVRCIKGKYEMPYSEYPHLMYDFQIIIQTAKNNLRPTIPQSTPPPFADLIRRCVAVEPEKRPSCDEILPLLDAFEKSFQESPAEWNACKLPKS